MAQKYTGDINFDTDWGGDESTGGLPVAGQVINNFVRANLKSSFRDMFFDPNGNIMHFFRTEADKELYISDPQTYASLPLKSIPLEFSGTIRQTRLINQLPSTSLNFTTNQTEANVSIQFVCQEKSITETEWQDTSFGGQVKVLVDAGATGEYVEITGATRHLVANEIFTCNIRDFIIAGYNTVKLQVVADDDKQTTGTLIYSVYLSEMYIEPLNLNWHTAFVENDPAFTLGGFRVVGALAKTLHIKITKGTHTYGEFEKYVGTAAYITSPLYFLQTDVPGGESMFPNGGTGVYQVDAWLTAGTLESQHVIYPLMCVETEDKNTAHLVAMYNVARTVFNYDTNHLFDLAIYNKGLSTGTPHVKVHATNEGSTAATFKDEDITIATDTAVAYNLNIEWITEATAALLLHVQATYAGSQEMNVIPIDNSGAYPPTSGYSFYMNAANRSNAQANKDKIINEADGSAIAPTWHNMAWVDGIDGWTADDAGRTCLRMPAGSRVSIPFQVMRSDNIAFDMTFKVANVADYDENIITIATNPTDAAFQGIRIRPTNITVHNSDDVGGSRDVQQGISFSDEESVNLFVTIARNYNGNPGKNLVTGYVNGCKAFQFEYGNVVWANNAPIVIGAEKSDVFVYSIRAYQTALGVSNAETNFINSLASRIERIEQRKRIDSVLNGLHQVDYEKVKNGGYNFFVIEMLNGATVPQRANGWAKDASGFANLEMHFGEHPLWDFKLYNVEISGQGTTSMDYYRWNFRSRIDKTDNGVTPKKSVSIAYYGDPTRDATGNLIYNELPAEIGTAVYFDGGNGDTTQQHPKLMRITGKTNHASSMQSHKIGATRAYTALHDAVVGNNEAQAMAEQAGTPIPTVAVYEYPAFGFAKTRIAGTDTYAYEFIGLFTIGPDKGDKPTFGYDKVKNTLLTLEGTDHAPRLATFRYPWNDDVEYRASNECLNIVTGSGTDDLEKAWEVSNAHGLGTDDAGDQADIQDLLVDEFKGAYDVAYKNSTLIHGIALDVYGATAAATLAYINAHKSEFNATAVTGTTYKYSDLEFWIDGEYTLYYEDKKTGLYTAGVNLLDQCGITASTLTGMTVAEKNEYFKECRRDFFKNGNTNTGHELGKASDYWNLQDSEFCFAFLIIFGVSDNFAKNSYPYKMKSILNGGRWCWRQDDLDTLFDGDNQGKDTKPYFIEFKDDSNGTPYFNGSNSVFWNLLFECYWEDIRSMGKSIIDAMRTIGGGQNTLQGFLNFIKRMFWDNAQNYFPKSAYNEDASYKYEASWLDPVHGQVTVDPLAQSLGDHYRAEYQWVMRRAIYAMSLFHAGPFGIGGYTDSSLGLMSVRATIPAISLKTAMAFYPALHVGTNTINNDERVMPDGEDEATFDNPSGGEDTTVYIPATDWLADLGDLKDLRVLGDNVKSLAVNGKRLRTFKLGDEDPSEVSSNIETLSFSGTPSLETIDCRNVANLGGSIDLTSCTRLKAAYFEGTKTVAIILPSGSKIEELSLSDFTNFIQLRNLQFLTEEGLTLPSSLEDITSLQVEGCKHIDSFQMLDDIISTEDNTLKYIRVVWSGVKMMSADSVDMLAQLADDTREGKYHGITPEGQVDDEANPTIEGDVQMNSGIYMSSLDRLGVDPSETEDWGQGLKRAVAKIFGTMHIIYNPNIVFIEFIDPEVLRIALANWDTNGDGGIGQGEADAVTGNLGTMFRNNTLIETFNELQYFHNVKLSHAQGSSGQFYGCTSLREITLPEGLTAIGPGSFYNCAALEKIEFDGQEHPADTLVIPSSITSIGATAFNGGCANLQYDKLISHGTLETGCFQNHPFSEIVHTGNMNGYAEITSSALERFEITGNITRSNGGGALAMHIFNQCSNLKVIKFNEGTTIDNNFRMFYNGGGVALTDIYIPSTITTIVTYFWGTSTTWKTSGAFNIHVPSIADWISKTHTGYTNNAHYFVVEENVINDIVVDDTVTAIPSNCFRGAVLNSITIPESVTTIGSSAFRSPQIKSVTVNQTTPPICGTDAFANMATTCPIYVPASAVEAYKAASGWSEYASRIQAIPA